MICKLAEQVIGLEDDFIDLENSNLVRKLAAIEIAKLSPTIARALLIALDAMRGELALIKFLESTGFDTKLTFADNGEIATTIGDSLEQALAQIASLVTQSKDNAGIVPAET